MDCKREFLSKVNINILWDIIYENTIYNNISISLDKLKLLFSNIINDFGNNEQMHNLIETNKKFIIEFRMHTNAKQCNTWYCTD